MNNRVKTKKVLALALLGVAFSGSNTKAVEQTQSQEVEKEVKRKIEDIPTYDFLIFQSAKNEELIDFATTPDVRLIAGRILRLISGENFPKALTKESEKDALALVKAVFEYEDESLSKEKKEEFSNLLYENLREQGEPDVGQVKYWFEWAVKNARQEIEHNDLHKRASAEPA